MATENEDLDIVVENDDAGTSKETAKVVTPQEGIDELKAQLDRERLAREEAERRASAAQGEIRRASAEVDDTNMRLVATALEQAKAETENLKSRYKTARIAGDVDSEADLLVELSSNAQKIRQLEEGKAAMEERAKNPPRPAQNTLDPVEAVAQQLSRRSADWVRSHPDYVTDPKKFAKVQAVDQLARAEGIAPDTDEYFEFVESTLKISKPVRNDPDDSQEASRDAAQVTQRRQSPPAAPPTRTSATDGARPNIVRLSREQREMAEMMGMTPQEYAKNLQKLKEEGRIN